MVKRDIPVKNLTEHLVGIGVGRQFGGGGGRSRVCERGNFLTSDNILMILLCITYIGQKLNVTC